MQSSGHFHTLSFSGNPDDLSRYSQAITNKLLFGARFLLLANNRTFEAKDKLNRRLNTEAQRTVLERMGETLMRLAAEKLTMPIPRRQYSIQTRRSRML